MMRMLCVCSQADSENIYEKQRVVQRVVWVSTATSYIVGVSHSAIVHRTTRENIYHDNVASMYWDHSPRVVVARGKITRRNTLMRPSAASQRYLRDAPLQSVAEVQV